MSAVFAPSSILGFGVVISLVAYFGGKYASNPALSNAAFPFVVLFVGVWVIYIGFSVFRSVQSITDSG